MSTASPTSLTLTQKKRLWQQQKYDNYQQISQDKALMWNYFLINNDIFNMISIQDQNKFKMVQLQCQNEKMNVLLYSVAGIFFIDQILLRFAAPKLRIPRFRFTVNFLKYVIGPLSIYTFYKQNYMGQYQIFFYNMQEKYQFGFQDYMNANKIYQRALAVDRLQELLEKRDQFDWTGIPQLVQDIKTNKDIKNIRNF